MAAYKQWTICVLGLKTICGTIACGRIPGELKISIFKCKQYYIHGVYCSIMSSYMMYILVDYSLMIRGFLCYSSKGRYIWSATALTCQLLLPSFLFSFPPSLLLLTLLPLYMHTHTYKFYMYTYRHTHTFSYYSITSFDFHDLIWQQIPPHALITATKVCSTFNYLLSDPAYQNIFSF